jgi:hypothetical protein
MGNILKFFSFSRPEEKTYSIAAGPDSEFFGGKRKKSNKSIKNNRSKKNKTRRH